MNEFKERIQFLLTQALNTQKKQQCLIEFNKLCIANKTEGHLKLLLSTLEMLKMNEVNLRALKISIQIYQYDLQNSMKAAQLIIKGYPEGNEALYQFSGECFRLLTNNESILPFCELLCPLALKLNSQPIQIGSTISLQYVLQFEVQINIKKQIQLAFIKNSLIIHQSFVEIMIQITQKDDINLGQILQRCLAGLQEQKHSYQVKIQLCKLLQQISSYTTYEQNQLLQCVTILREVTLNKVIALQQIAKQALSSYQSLYIAINPPSITNSNFFPDIKPFIKKKRGDNHLILDTDKQKKLKISQIPQIKQQLDRLKISSIDEQIQTELLEQQIQNDQKQNEQLNISQEIINSNIQEINNESKDTQIYEDVQLLKTLDYNDEIDNNSYDYTQDALKKINDGEINDAFKIALQQKDDLLLIKLMMNTNDYFKSLTRQTAEELIKNIIQKLNFRSQETSRFIIN